MTLASSTATRAVAPGDLLIAAGLILTSCAAFGALDGLSKLLATDMPLVQVLWARFIFFVVPLLVFVGPRRWPSLWRTDRPGLQMLRGALPLVSGCFVVPATLLLPLADVTAIMFMTPLLLVVLAGPLLGERVSTLGWSAVAIGLVGVTVIVRPGASALAWAALLPLASALISAFFQVATRLLRGADPLSTLFYTGASGAVVTTLLLPFFWQPQTLAGWLMLVATGLLHGTGHFGYILAYRRAPAAMLAPLSYCQIIAAVVFGYFVFDEVPDLLTLVGAVVVVLAGLMVLRTRPAR